MKRDDDEYFFPPGDFFHPDGLKVSDLDPEDVAIYRVMYELTCHRGEPDEHLGKFFGDGTLAGDLVEAHSRIIGDPATQEEEDRKVQALERLSKRFKPALNKPRLVGKKLLRGIKCSRQEIMSSLSRIHGPRRIKDRVTGKFREPETFQENVRSLKSQIRHDQEGDDPVHIVRVGEKRLQASQISLEDADREVGNLKIRNQLAAKIGLNSIYRKATRAERRAILNYLLCLKNGGDTKSCDQQAIHRLKNKLRRP